MKESAEVDKLQTMRKAVIIYGPPGAGKGTQAGLLARRFQFIHFDTGRYIERLFLDSAVKKDLVLRREKEKFDTGELCTPSWILEIVSDATQRIAEAGFSITYSGSPRTEFEAFGDEKHEGLLKLLEKLYGKENIFIFLLDISAETSIKRNSSRVVCSVCGLPILAESQLKRCAFCSGKARKRTLDSPEVIKVRLEEFKKRTYPIIERIKEKGYVAKKINGTPPPYRVFEAIIQSLGL